jgi:hypothetical protein
MPKNKPYNMAYGHSALRTGGKRLAEITGEDEPVVEQKNVLSEGFRRLGGVKKAERKLYREDD